MKKKKYSEDSTRTGNSRNSNHSHQKIPMINLSKNQISIDFIKAYRTKNKNFKLKHNNSKSMNLQKVGKLTISTNLYHSKNKIFKKGVLFKKNNHYSSISAFNVKSPLILYSNQSRRRLNSSNKKNNSFINIKNGIYVLSSKKFLYNNLDEKKKI